jgi:hypothetical protein
MTETKPASRPAVLAALLTVYIIWGSTYLAIRFAVATLPPFLMAGVRFLIARRAPRGRSGAARRSSEGACCWAATAWSSGRSDRACRPA